MFVQNRWLAADIKNNNKHHRNEQLNRQLQNFMHGVLGDDNEAAAKKSLAVRVTFINMSVCPSVYSSVCCLYFCLSPVSVRFALPGRMLVINVLAWGPAATNVLCHVLHCFLFIVLPAQCHHPIPSVSPSMRLVCVHVHHSCGLKRMFTTCR